MLQNIPFSQHDLAFTELTGARHRCFSATWLSLERLTNTQKRQASSLVKLAIHIILPWAALQKGCGCWRMQLSGTSQEKEPVVTETITA